MEPSLKYSTCMDALGLEALWLNMGHGKARKKDISDIYFYFLWLAIAAAVILFF